jgi:hypothetical protein
MRRPFRRGSGIRFPEALLLLAVVLAVLSGCLYTFQAGAGLPGHVRTLAVIPFENETGRFELTGEIQERLLDELPRTFGVTVAGEEHADAVIRGTIRSYNVDAPSFRPGAAPDRTEVVERRVTIMVEVQVVDRIGNVILWENRSLSARGEYLEDAELEEDGRHLAIDRLAQAVIDGLQSNW